MVQGAIGIMSYQIGTRSEQVRCGFGVGIGKLALLSFFLLPFLGLALSSSSTSD
jgi:hypothetical protein